MENNIYPINVIFEFNNINNNKYKDPYSENEKHKHTVIKNGNFNHKEILNLNFYERENTKIEANSQLKPNPPKDFNINMAYSSNYISRQNLETTLKSIQKVDRDYPLIRTILEFINDDNNNIKEIFDKQFNKNKPNVLEKIKLNLTKESTKLIETYTKPNDESNNISSISEILKMLFIENIGSLPRTNPSKSNLINYLIDDIFYNFFKNESDTTIKEQYRQLFYKPSDYTNINNIDELFQDTNKAILKNFFEKLERDRIDNDSEDKNQRRYGSEIKKIPTNTSEKRNEILFKFSEHFLSREQKNDIKIQSDFEKRFLNNSKILKNIMTYYNIYNILNDYFIISGTLIKYNTNFLKINNLKPVYQKSNNNNIINSNIINVVFEIDYELIPSASYINFNTLINVLNPKYENNFIKKRDKTNRDNYYNKKAKLFTNKNYKNIYFNIALNYKKIIKDFQSIKKKIEYIDNKDINNINEFFMDENIYNYL